MTDTQSAAEWWNAPGRIEALKQMWADGLTAAQIANELGAASRNAVLGKVHRLRIADTKPKQEARPPKPKKKAPAPSIRYGLIKPRRPTPPVLPEVTHPIGTGSSLLETIQASGCRFAVTPHNTTEHLFCNAPRAGIAPYCGAHCRVAFNYEAPSARRALQRIGALA